MSTEQRKYTDELTGRVLYTKWEGRIVKCIVRSKYSSSEYCGKWYVTLLNKDNDTPLGCVLVHQDNMWNSSKEIE